MDGGGMKDPGGKENWLIVVPLAMYRWPLVRPVATKSAGSVAWTVTVSPLVEIVTCVTMW